MTALSSTTEPAIAPQPARATLDTLARDRNNNFNVIRFTLALMVLVHHGFELTGNPIDATGYLTRLLSSFGEVGVGGFFIVSGFLVTRSLFGRSTLTKFVLARVLRIYPGLWVMLVVTTFTLGFASSLGPGAYLTDPGTWSYALRNATAFLITFFLPGVFADNPVNAANGSLWSLKYEMLCYVALAFAGATGLAQRRWPLLAVAALCAAAIIFLPDDINYFLDLMRRLGFLFALGACAAAFAHLLVLRFAYVAALVALALLIDPTPAGGVMWSVAFGYGLLWAAYVPKGALLAFNRLPDVSYGLYIYAFPIQQLAIHFDIGATPAANIAIALPLTYICAALSWYGIEKPALEFKNRIGVRQDPRAKPETA